MSWKRIRYTVLTVTEAQSNFDDFENIGVHEVLRNRT